MQNELEKGILRYVDSSIENAPYTQIYTGLIKASTSDGYTIDLNGIEYTSVPSKGTFSTNDTVRVVVPNNQYSNMFILSDSTGGGTGAVSSVNGITGDVVLDKSDIGLGNVPNVTTNNQTPTFTMAGTDSDLVNGETLTISFGKIAKAINSLISHISDSIRHITSTERTNWNTAYTNNHTHSNKTTLDNTTASYTTAEKTKLSGIENGAEVNNISDTNATDLTDDGDTTLHYHATDRNRANHTGTQLASTVSDFASTVRSTVLTGLSTATNAVISATDTVLSALGKLQKQISDNLTTLTSHTSNKSNPHGVTKTQVGLSNVDNVQQYSASNPQISVTGSSGSCTGNSATASALTTNAGTTTRPVYFSGGIPVVGQYTLRTACSKACTDSSSASAISTGKNVTTERDVYYGLPTINGAHNYTSNTNIYAPTSVGTSGQVLNSNGSGAPSWVNQSALSVGKATQDSLSQQIDSTYIKALSVLGSTITYTKGNGTTGTITVVTTGNIQWNE